MDVTLLCFLFLIFFFLFLCSAEDDIVFHSVLLPLRNNIIKQTNPNSDPGKYAFEVKSSHGREWYSTSAGNPSQKYRTQPKPSQGNAKRGQPYRGNLKKIQKRKPNQATATQKGATSKTKTASWTKPEQPKRGQPLLTPPTGVRELPRSPGFHTRKKKLFFYLFILAIRNKRKMK